MLPLDDPRWQTYEGGYRVPYDASPILLRLIERGAAPELWDELWEELYHQDNVGSASYAAVPWLVEFVRRSPKLDWNPLGLIAVVELARPSNPPIPPELSKSYSSAIRSIPGVLGSHQDQAWDETATRFAVACIALGRGTRWYAKACFELDRGTAERWFSEEFGWRFDE